MVLVCDPLEGMSEGPWNIKGKSVAGMDPCVALNIVSVASGECIGDNLLASDSKPVRTGLKGGRL